VVKAAKKAASSAAKAATDPMVIVRPLLGLLPDKRTGAMLTKMMTNLVQGNGSGALKVIKDYVMIFVKRFFIKFVLKTVLYKKQGYDALKLRRIGDMYIKPIFGGHVTVSFENEQLTELMGRPFDLMNRTCVGSADYKKTGLCSENIYKALSKLSPKKRKEFRWLDPDYLKKSIKSVVDDMSPAQRAALTDSSFEKRFRRRAVQSQTVRTYLKMSEPDTERLDRRATTWAPFSQFYGVLEWCNALNGTMVKCDPKVREKHALNGAFQGTERIIPRVRFIIANYARDKNGRPTKRLQCKVHMYTYFFLCRTCCCAKGFNMSSKKLELVEVGKDAAGNSLGGYCSEWFQYADIVAGAVLSVVRASKSGASSRNFGGKCLKFD
jgi:hypothetical protein